MNTLYLTVPPVFALRKEVTAPAAGAGHSFSDLLNSFVKNVSDTQQINPNLMLGKMQSTHVEGIANAKSDVMLHLITRMSEKLSMATSTMLQTPL